MNRRHLLKALLFGTAALMNPFQLTATAQESFNWIVGIGDSLTWGAWGFPSTYFNLVSQYLNLSNLNLGQGGLTTRYLMAKSIVAQQTLLAQDLTGAGLVLCTCGINDLRRIKRQHLFDLALDRVIANIQAVANFWNTAYPGTEFIILPPVANGIRNKGMQRNVTEAYLTRLVYPAVPLDWYPQDTLHDYKKPDTWWADWLHPNVAGHQAMADAIIQYLGNLPSVAPTYPVFPFPTCVPRQPCPLGN